MYLRSPVSVGRGDSYKDKTQYLRPPSVLWLQNTDRHEASFPGSLDLQCPKLDTPDAQTVEHGVHRVYEHHDSKDRTCPKSKEAQRVSGYEKQGETSKIRPSKLLQAFDFIS